MWNYYTLSYISSRGDMMLARIYDDIKTLIRPQKALIIYGARRVGKTTLLTRFLQQTPLRYRFDSGDNIRIQELLGSRDFTKILEYVGDYELIVIDEAQEIPHIGTALKIIVDQAPQVTVIATGSSSFELAQQVGEPLTGRKISAILYPLSQKELTQQHTRHELREKLEEFLIFGSYPEVLVTDNRREKIRILQELVDSYLLKDILSHERIRSPKTLLQLIKMLAFQLGNEVSLNELANHLRVDVKTVARYLDLLEKTFVIKRLGGFSRNLRKEVTSKAKYYFYDNGVRNAVISQMNLLEDRNDHGALFENFILMERMKKLAYEDFYGNLYFWRTYDGQEIDLVEEIDGKLAGFECKWSEKKKGKIPKDWRKHYDGATFTVINRDNYLDFVL